MNLTVTKLIGGLGNQLFQYAVGRAVSLQNRSELVLDDSPFIEYTDRKYSLDSFAIPQRFPSEEEASIIRSSLAAENVVPEKRRFFLNKFFRRARQQNLKIIKESRFPHFEPEILALPPNVYLDGYWQSARYFQQIEEVLRKDLQLIKPLSPYSLNLRSQIMQKEAVSLHIRRADYISSSYILNLIGICEPPYYHQAISEILQRVPKAHFFIFSDEPGWAKANLKLPEAHTLVEPPAPTKDYEDMILMSNCQHHIIANSTYSWWGAWLNPSKSKVVIAPKKWFNSWPDHVDLFLPNWIRL